MSFCSSLLTAATGLALTSPAGLVGKLAGQQWLLPGSDSRTELGKWIGDPELTDENRVARRRNSIVKYCEVQTTGIYPDTTGQKFASMSVSLYGGDVTPESLAKPRYGEHVWAKRAMFHLYLPNGTSDTNAHVSYAAEISSQKALVAVEVDKGIRSEAKIFWSAADNRPNRIILKQTEIVTGRVVTDVDCGAPVAHVAQIPFELDPAAWAPRYSGRDPGGVGDSALLKAGTQPGTEIRNPSVGQSWQDYPLLAHTEAFQQVVRPMVEAARDFSRLGDNSWDTILRQTRFQATKSTANGDVAISFTIPVAFYSPVVAGTFQQRRRILAHAVGRYIRFDKDKDRHEIAVSRFYTLETQDKEDDRIVFDLHAADGNGLGIDLRAELTSSGEVKIHAPYRNFLKGTVLQYAGIPDGKRHLFTGKYWSSPVSFWFERETCGAELTRTTGVFRKVTETERYSGSCEF